ncbi:putative leucine-rich repeat-containing protein DDB_G0290503 isoform X1 [Oryzias latipes]|uniref:putative leucine-rich repeat-containing protein DDB_G0290503 isoform X1 n=1 Tax=Oryzias latipes TaxID=8090 RepID=UPI000CE1BA05|nr:putative leucine-rich repeat-containing protein DDB_G0290503 isoform X1 [Oryzias latipes]
MVGTSSFIWVLLILTAVCKTSDLRHVSNVRDIFESTGNPEVDEALSKIPFDLGDMTDPSRINVTKIKIQLCTGMKEALASMKLELAQTTRRYNELDEETLGLRREVRKLQMRLSTCSSTASAIAGSYQAQLQTKMNQLLDVIDSETFQILKILGVTREVQVLQKKLQLASKNATATSEIKALQREVQEKATELNSKREPFENSHPNAALILQIISLQSQIWDLHQTESKGEAVDQSDSRILVLQEQLNGKIRELQSKEETISAVLEMLSVHSKITQIQKTIRVLTEESKNRNAAFLLQWRQKGELLTKKISQLANDVDNQELTKEILRLQNELSQLAKLQKDKESLEAQLKAKIDEMEAEKSREEALQKKLEQTDYATSQLIFKIISVMEELRQQRIVAPTGETQDILTLLQTYKRDYAEAKTEIKDLKEKLERTQEECSGLQEKHDKLKTELAQKIMKLNRTEDSKAALILNVINLHAEIKALREQISKSKSGSETSQHSPVLVPRRQIYWLQSRSGKNISSPLLMRRKPQDLNDEPQLHPIKAPLFEKTTFGLNDRFLPGEQDGIMMRKELMRQLEQKQEELNLKTAEIQRLISNPQTILEIIDLQNKIWDLEKKNTNWTNKELQALKKRLDSLVNEIDSNGEDNTLQVLKILTLQSQVEYLQNQLSNLEITHDSTQTQLQNELAAKENELKRYIHEVMEKNQTNGKLILSITELQIKLKDIEKQKEKEDNTSAATISKLTNQLKLQEEENNRNKAFIMTLQNKITQTETQCSEYEQKIKDLQSDINTKLKELKSKSDTVSSLVLQISTLSVEVEQLGKQLQNSVSKSKVEELTAIIEEKNKELEQKAGELKERSPEAQKLLRIIAVQVEIERLVNVGANNTNANQIKVLKKELSTLINGIEDKTSENTKLVFQILSQQDEISLLKKEKVQQLEEKAKLIKDLEDERDNIKKQIEEKTQLLNSNDMRIANFSHQIMELYKKIQPLEDEISDLKETYTEKLAELTNRLNVTQKELQQSEQLLKQSDSKNYELIMKITELRSQLKEAKEKGSKDAEKDIAELEEKVQFHQKENAKLENANKNLKQQMEELKECCTVNTKCEDLQKKLQQSQEDADRLLQQLEEKDGALKRLQQNFEEQNEQKVKLQEDHDNLLKRLVDLDEKTIYATKLTLDPNTAHPRVDLSADRTEMFTLPEIAPVQDNPGRYDTALAVLGSTGFNKGKNYWEVSVAGKSCYHLGMASESAPRKGSLSFRPRNGFWTIVLNKQGQLKSIDQRITTIPIEVHPLRIGVLLDYEKGVISFFDAGSRSHLYSFTGQAFTDKIYPFLNYCVEDSTNPIVMLSPGSTDWIKS